METADSSAIMTDVRKWIPENELLMEDHELSQTADEDMHCFFREGTSDFLDPPRDQEEPSATIPLPYPFSQLDPFDTDPPGIQLSEEDHAYLYNGDYSLDGYAVHSAHADSFFGSSEIFPTLLQAERKMPLLEKVYVRYGEESHLFVVSDNFTFGELLKDALVHWGLVNDGTKFELHDIQGRPFPLGAALHILTTPNIVAMSSTGVPIVSLQKQRKRSRKSEPKKKNPPKAKPTMAPPTAGEQSTAATASRTPSPSPSPSPTAGVTPAPTLAPISSEGGEPNKLPTPTKKKAKPKAKVEARQPLSTSRDATAKAVEEGKAAEGEEVLLSGSASGSDDAKKDHAALPVPPLDTSKLHPPAAPAAKKSQKSPRKAPSSARNLPRAPPSVQSQVLAQSLPPRPHSAPPYTTANGLSAATTSPSPTSSPSSSSSPLTSSSSSSSSLSAAAFMAGYPAIAPAPPPSLPSLPAPTVTAPIPTTSPAGTAIPSAANSTTVPLPALKPEARRMQRTSLVKPDPSHGVKVQKLDLQQHQQALQQLQLMQQHQQQLAKYQAQGQPPQQQPPQTEQPGPIDHSSTAFGAYYSTIPSVSAAAASSVHVFGAANGALPPAAAAPPAIMPVAAKETIAKQELKLQQYINPAAKPKEVTPKLLAKAAGSGGTSATKTVSPKPMPNYPPAIQPAPMKGAPRSPQFLAAQHLRAAQAQGLSPQQLSALTAALAQGQNPFASLPAPMLASQLGLQGAQLPLAANPFSAIPPPHKVPIPPSQSMLSKQQHKPKPPKAKALSSSLPSLPTTASSKSPSTSTAASAATSAAAAATSAGTSCPQQNASSASGAAAALSATPCSHPNAMLSRSGGRHARSMDTLPVSALSSSTAPSSNTVTPTAATPPTLTFAPPYVPIINSATSPPPPPSSGNNNKPLVFQHVFPPASSTSRPVQRPPPPPPLPVATSASSSSSSSSFPSTTIDLLFPNPAAVSSSSSPPGSPTIALANLELDTLVLPSSPISSPPSPNIT